MIAITCIGILITGLLMARVCYCCGYTDGYKDSMDDGQREQTIWARRRSGERK